MEFKGSKGLWFNDDGVIEDKEGREICYVYSNWPTKKDLYDRQLISKAPEMLEMLHKAKLELSRIKCSMMAHPDCEEGSEFDDYTNSAEEVENEIEQLIKQATEL